MNRFEFISSEHMTSRLAELLRDPVMEHALQIIRNEAIPGVPVQQGGDLIQQAAIAGMRAEGRSKAILDLILLTKFKSPDQKDKEEEFDQSAIKILVSQGYTEPQAKAAMKEYYQTQQAP